MDNWTRSNILYWIFKNPPPAKNVMVLPMNNTPLIMGPARVEYPREEEDRSVILAHHQSCRCTK